MKEFKKSKEDLFICEECQRLFKNKVAICTHISMKHGAKQYFDKWLKENNEGKCSVCGKESKFSKIKNGGYRKTCSKECANKSKGKNFTEETFEKRKQTSLKHYGTDIPAKSQEIKDKTKKTLLSRTLEQQTNINQKRKQTCLKTYGVEFITQVEEIKQKTKETCLKIYGVSAGFADMEKIKKTKKQRYGNENYNNMNKNKQTCLQHFGVEYSLQVKEVREKGKETKQEKYNDENYNNRKRYKETCLNKFGVENPSQFEEIKNKKKETCLKNNGCESPMQNRDIFDKSFKTRILIHHYKNTNLTYQGSYELDFLEKFYDKIDIENGLSIKYMINEKNKVYHSDFYIPSKNLIVEIKSSWILTLDVEIEAKKKATIANGFNYIMIIDKDYSNFYGLYS